MKTTHDQPRRGIAGLAFALLAGAAAPAPGEVASRTGTA
jgi:hypothetical protein